VSIPAANQSAKLLALSELADTLLCGEESASLAFELLARRRRRLGDGPEMIAALTRIAQDEREHEALLRKLKRELPAVESRVEVARAESQFFRSLGCHDAGGHFTRIAALDSAVCVLLSTLRKAQPQLFCPALQRVHSDEARHVAVAATYAKRLTPRVQRIEQVAATRHGLADVLTHRAACFESLCIDPDRLLTRLREPPRFLCH
jgi:hypothetical protein